MGWDSSLRGVLLEIASCSSKHLCPNPPEGESRSRAQSFPRMRETRWAVLRPNLPPPPPPAPRFLDLTEHVLSPRRW